MKEELEELDNDEMLVCPMSSVSATGVERRQVMNDKIVAMGRIAGVVRFVGVRSTALSPLSFSFFPGENSDFFFSFFFPFVVFRICRRPEKVSELNLLPDRTNCRMGLLLWPRRAFRRLVMVSRMRTYTPCLPNALFIFLFSWKSDVENGHLPPELFDTEAEEGRAIIHNFLPTTPANEAASGIACDTP
jgi:hypothetical protein